MVHRSDMPLAARLARLPRPTLTRTFRALRTPNYRLYWIGQVVSMVGTWMQIIAQAWLVLKLTDSPLALGVVGACQTLPVLCIALFGGVIADRVPKRRLLLGTQGLMLAQAAALAVLTGTGRISLVALYVLAGVLGIATALDNPTRQAFIKELVKPEDVPNAIALNAITMQVARLIGPALAGVAIATIGTTACFALNAVSFVAVIVALGMMRPDQFFAVPPPQHGKMLAQIGAGMRYALQTPEIAPILLICATFGIFAYNLNVLLPLIARYVLHTDPLGLSALTTALAVGSMIGALGVASRGVGTPRLLFRGAVGFSVVLLIIGLSAQWLVIIPALVVLGVCSMLYFTTSMSRVQAIVAPEFRGRVMGLYALLDIGTAPIGTVLMGGLATRVGVQPTTVLFALACALGICAGWFFTLRQRAAHAGEPPIRHSLP